MISKDGSAESGSNAGSNFAIERYNDAGALLNKPISINRASGWITLDGNLVLTGLPTSASGLPSGGVWRDAAAGNVLKIVP